MVEGQKSKRQSLEELREALQEERKKVAPMMQGSRHGYTSQRMADLFARIARITERQSSGQQDPARR